MPDAAACPICGRPSAPVATTGRRSTAPFCSARCADIDLGRWFTGQYRVPAEPNPDNEDDDTREVDRSGVPG